MQPHPAGAALSHFRIHRDRHRNRRPRRSNLSRQLEHPRPQLAGVVDAVPRTVAADDKTMRRRYPNLDIAYIPAEPPLQRAPASTESP
jgi:hypothetical protein